jgi:hypothetical protein
MVVLRADPWMPEFGMGFQAAGEDDGPDVHASPFIEQDDWTEPIETEPDPEPGPVWFVDGVRRVEIRLVADADGRRVPGLFGSHGVGSVCSDGRQKTITS